MRHTLSSKALDIKRTALADRSLHVVSPSRWLAGLAGASSLFATANAFLNIPNGVPTDIFHPIDRKLARRALGLPVDGLLVGFGAFSVSAWYKGPRELQECLGRMHNRNTQLVTYGMGLPPAVDLVTHHMGMITSPLLMRLVYAASDIFCVPSLEDNLPNTVLEAMACGIPVVAFDTGGIPDMVRSGATGLLAPRGDVEALANALNMLLTDHKLRLRMGEICRQVVEQEYSSEVQAKAYIALYERALVQRDSHTAC